MTKYCSNVFSLLGSLMYETELTILESFSLLNALLIQTCSGPIIVRLSETRVNFVFNFYFHLSGNRLYKNHLHFVGELQLFTQDNDSPR